AQAALIGPSEEAEASSDAEFCDRAANDVRLLFSDRVEPLVVGEKDDMPEKAPTMPIPPPSLGSSGYSEGTELLLLLGTSELLVLESVETGVVAGVLESTVDKSAASTGEATNINAIMAMQRSQALERAADGTRAQLTLLELLEGEHSDGEFGGVDRVAV
ncbi:hypothetical protein GGI14_006295, partial [Coemansia sp. S680]